MYIEAMTGIKSKQQDKSMLTSRLKPTLNPRVLFGIVLPVKVLWCSHRRCPLSGAGSNRLSLGVRRLY